MPLIGQTGMSAPPEQIVGTRSVPTTLVLAAVGGVDDGDGGRNLTPALGVIIINAQGLHRSSLMSIWNKVLVWVIGVASVALFYMAARTLKTHQYWRELAQKYERKIEQVQQQNRVLLEGGGNAGGQSQLGIRQRRIELNKLLLDRHRVWFKCDPRSS